MIKTGKTNKSFLKRFKKTKRGKILARKPGQNHFLAKKKREKKLKAKKLKKLVIKKKVAGKYLPK